MAARKPCRKPQDTNVLLKSHQLLKWFDSEAKALVQLFMIDVEHGRCDGRAAPVVGLREPGLEVCERLNSTARCRRKILGHFALSENLPGQAA